MIRNTPKLRTNEELYIKTSDGDSDTSGHLYHLAVVASLLAGALFHHALDAFLLGDPAALWVDCLCEMATV